MFFQNRYFYEKPDGEALCSKILDCMEIPLTAAVTLGLIDGMRPGKSVGTLYTFGRMVQRFVPMGYMAFMFTVGTHIIARIRQKNDAMNHGLGALAAIPVLRAYSSLQFTIGVGTFLVLGAAIGKAVAEDPVVGRVNRRIQPHKTDTISWYMWTGGKIPPTGLIKYD